MPFVLFLPTNTEHLKQSSSGTYANPPNNIELKKLHKIIPIVYEYLNTKEKCSRKQGFIRAQLCTGKRGCRFCRYRLCLLILKKFPKLRIDPKQQELKTLYTFLNSYREELFKELAKLVENGLHNKKIVVAADAVSLSKTSAKILDYENDFEKNSSKTDNCSNHAAMMQPAVSFQIASFQRAECEKISEMDQILKQIHGNPSFHTHFRNRIDVNFEVYDVILGVGLKRNDGSFLNKSELEILFQNAKEYTSRRDTVFMKSVLKLIFLESYESRKSDLSKGVNTGWF